jgi:hypothetical protein
MTPPAAHSKAHPVHLLPPKGDGARSWALAALVLAPVCTGLLALFLGADASWDLRNYHWYNAYAYLTGRIESGIDFLPSQSQFFLNPWLDVPFYLLATHLPLKLVYFLLGCVQGLNFPLLFMIAYATLVIRDARQKTAACAAIAALGLFSAMGLSEIGTVFYDNVTSLGILSSALLLLWRLDELQKAKLARALPLAALFGLPAGLCAGLKMTCGSFCVAECFALVVATGITRRSLLVASAFACGVFLGWLATYGHQAWFLFENYANPTFPFFNRLFRSPLMPPQPIGDYFVQGGAAKLLHPFMIVLQPYLTNEILWRDWRVPILYVFLIIAVGKTLLKGIKTDGGAMAQTKQGRFLLSMGVASYVAWISFEAVYRYLLPLDMLAPLLITVCAGMFPGDLRTRWQTAAAALIVIAVTIQPGTWGRHKIWPEGMVSVSGPMLKDSGDTLVLMAGYDAYAYLLPAFPPHVGFLRIGSRTFHPDDDYGINDLIRMKIGAHKGPLKLFMTARQMKRGEEALAAYGLALIPKTCQTISDNLYEAQLDKPDEMMNDYPPAYSLCDVKRVSKTK